jgi:membrane dipeptidase
MFVLDSHCDTPSEILRGRDLSIDNHNAHVDFPKLVKGGVDGAFFALYIPAAFDSDPESGFDHAERMLEVVERSVSENSDIAAFASNRIQALKNREEGKFSVFLALENGSPIGDSIDNIKWFYDKGIRYITLCHSSDNQICDSCASAEKTWGGLSPFGREVVAEMNRLGILVDVSHVSDDTFYDVLKYSSRPVVATHSCCRAICGHPRNMTDDMIKALADAGGVIQINFYPFFLDPEFTDIDSSIRPSYKKVADHIDHVVSLVGIDHVGIGSDFDGIEVTPEGMDDISMMPVLFEELKDRGYSESDLEKLAGENFFRVLG